MNNDFRYICCDMVVVWGMLNINVLNNSMVGGDDDCILLN